jgi:hypothetical protein
MNTSVAGGSGSSAWARLVPSGPECVGAFLTLALPLAFGHWWLSLDGDPGRHIRVGETILRSGLFYTDPFSFSRPGAPFVPYEWLSEVLFAASVRLAGLGGIIVLTGTVLALTYAVVTRTLLRRGVGAGLTALTVLFVMALGFVHWHARPHVFTLLCAALLMAIVDRARTPGASAWRVIWPTALLFAVWANLHGAFLFGLAVLVGAVVGDRLEMLASADPDRTVWRGHLERHAVMLGTALIATLLTPSGIGLYGHTIGYLGDTYLVNHTQEYLSPDFHTVKFALIAIVLVVVALGAMPRRPRWPTLVLVALTLAFALGSARNLPLFGIVALPLVAAELAPLFPWDRPRARRTGRLVLVLPAIAMSAVFALARTTHVLPATFNPQVFPVAAVKAARAAHVSGRLYSEFTWGGYVLYAWPEQRVFIDGQTDFYGDSIFRAYNEIHKLSPDWRARLATWRIDVALLDPDTPLGAALAREPDWHAIYRDSTAVLYSRAAR